MNSAPESVKRATSPAQSASKKLLPGLSAGAGAFQVLTALNRMERCRDGQDKNKYQKSFRTRATIFTTIYPLKKHN